MQRDAARRTETHRDEPRCGEMRRLSRSTRDWRFPNLLASEHLIITMAEGRPLKQRDAARCSESIVRGDHESLTTTRFGRRSRMADDHMLWEAIQAGAAGGALLRWRGGHPGQGAAQLSPPSLARAILGPRLV